MSTGSDIADESRENPTPALAAETSADSDANCARDDIPIATIHPALSEAVVAFRLGRMMWRLRTLLEPLAFTNSQQSRCERDRLSVLLDAALVRLTSSQDRLNALQDLQKQFDNWNDWLGAQWRHEELSDFYEKLSRLPIYDQDRIVQELYSELDRSGSNHFYGRVTEQVTGLLPNETRMGSYLLGYAVEQGIIPNHSFLSLIRFSNDSASTNSGENSALQRGPREARQVSPTPETIAIEPILPGELPPDLKWRGMLENRCRDMELAPPVEVLDRILSAEPETGADLPSASGEVRDDENDDDEDCIAPVATLSSAEIAASRERSRLAAAQRAERIRCLRLRGFQELVDLLERDLGATAVGQTENATVPPEDEQVLQPSDPVSEGSAIAAMPVEVMQSREAVVGRPTSKAWYHSSEPEADSKYRYPLQGNLTMKQIQSALELTANTIRNQALTGRIWVMKLRQARYRVWLQSAEAASAANGRLPPPPNS